MDMGRGEERVRCMEKSNMETYITICKIDSKTGIWLRNMAKKLKQGLCINRDGMGREMGGGSKGRGYMYIYG